MRYRPNLGRTQIKNVIVDFSGDLSVGIRRIEKVIEGLDVGDLINNVGFCIYLRGSSMGWMKNC